jgi:hypothetical protein
MAPYVIEHIGDKVAGDGDQGDEVALARRLAAFDALIHGLISGHVASQVLSHVDGSVAAVGRTLLGDPLSLKEGGTGDVLACG